MRPVTDNFRDAYRLNLSCAIEVGIISECLVGCLAGFANTAALNCCVLPSLFVIFIITYVYVVGYMYTLCWLISGLNIWLIDVQYKYFIVCNKTIVKLAKKLVLIT